MYLVVYSLLGMIYNIPFMGTNVAKNREWTIKTTHFFLKKVKIVSLKRHWQIK